MILGFTGTSKRDLTRRQLRQLEQGLRGVNVLHLGDCIHADAQAWAEAIHLDIRTIGHPPLDDARRAHCLYDEERKPKDFIARNHDIVDEGADGLIAMPATFEEVLRSGTWATVRYARKLKRKIWIVLPDGSVQAENA